MRIRLPGWLRVPLAVILMIASTLVHVTPLFMLAIVKAVLPLRSVRRWLDHGLMWLAESWIGVNSALIEGLTRTRIVVDCPEGLQPDGHYLVLANHQSWVDIPVLQKVFNRRIPLLRFFLKRQLFWVPVLGLAWWALNFPFMRRYSREQLARRPELAGRDIEETRRACRRFRDLPVAVMNFVEGTRYTTAKHARQGSPYQHLLRPKAGGVAFVLDAMADGLRAILDVSIVYPGGRPTLADLFADRVAEVFVHVRLLPIPVALATGDYQGDGDYRQRFQGWMNELWREKDRRIDALLHAGETVPASPRAG